MIFVVLLFALGAFYVLGPAMFVFLFVLPPVVGGIGHIVNSVLEWDDRRRGHVEQGNGPLPGSRVSRQRESPLVRKCKNCGCQMSEGAAWCVNCGLNQVSGRD